MPNTTRNFVAGAMQAFACLGVAQAQAVAPDGIKLLPSGLLGFGNAGLYWPVRLLTQDGSGAIWAGWFDSVWIAKLPNTAKGMVQSIISSVMAK